MSKFYTVEERQMFYDSEEWEKIKKSLFKIRGKQCEKCGSKKNIQVHHLTYERFGGEELFVDLLILCSKCHKKVHGIQNKNVNNYVKIELPDFLILPKEIYFNLNLPDGAFKLFAVFNLYQNSELGCYASNFYLSKVVGMDERSITRNISILEKWFYIKIENKKSPTKRRIFINSKYKEIYDKPVKEVWEIRKSVEKFNSKKIKEIFINARENNEEK